MTHMEFDGTFGGYLKHMRWHYLLTAVYLLAVLWPGDSYAGLQLLIALVGLIGMPFWFGAYCAKTASYLVHSSQMDGQRLHFTGHATGVVKIAFLAILLCILPLMGILQALKAPRQIFLALLLPLALALVAIGGWYLHQLLKWAMGNIEQEEEPTFTYHGSTEQLIRLSIIYMGVLGFFQVLLSQLTLGVYLSTAFSVVLVALRFVLQFLFAQKIVTLLHYQGKPLALVCSKKQFALLAGKLVGVFIGLVVVLFTLLTSFAGSVGILIGAQVGLLFTYWYSYTLDVWGIQHIVYQPKETKEIQEIP
jgi:hypothetical protein